MAQQKRFKRFLDHRSGELMALTARASNGRYHVTSSPDKADCVVGFSFGYRTDSRGSRLPGPANQALANFALTYNLPKFLQSEIDEACKDQLEPTDVRLGLKGAKYVDSYAIFLEAQRFMKLHGYERPLLIAHPYHMPRLQAVYKRAGIEAIVPPDLPAVWDKESTQIWTRSPAQWRPREAGAITYYLLRGWL